MQAAVADVRWLFEFPTGNMVEVTPEEVEEYQTNGAVCLRGVFSQERIQKVKEGIEINLQNPSK